jgi:hypothetical protein
MYIGLHVKYRHACQISMKLEFFLHILEKILKINENASELFRTDKRTDIQKDMTKLTVAIFRKRVINSGLITVAARSKAWACGFSLVGTGLESRRGHGCVSVVIVVCCHVEVSAEDRSLVQRSPDKCGVSEYDLETSPARRSIPTMAVEP